MLIDHLKNFFNLKKNSPMVIEQIDSGWKIKVISGEDSGEEFPLEYTFILLGRQDNKRDDERQYAIRFKDQSVSYDQACLKWYPGKRKYSITHTKKPIVNHTYLNHWPLDVGVEVLVKHNDEVRMGNLVFQVLNNAVTEKMEKTEELKSGKKKKRKKAPVEMQKHQDITEDWIYTGYRIKIIKGADKGFEMEINSRKTVIGRGEGDASGTSVRLPISDKGISKNHAELIWNEDLEMLEILHLEKAKNVTRIYRDSKKGGKIIDLTPGEKKPLMDGDTVVMAGTYIQVSRESLERNVKGAMKSAKTTGEGTPSTDEPDEIDLDFSESLKSPDSGEPPTHKFE